MTRRNRSKKSSKRTQSRKQKSMKGGVMTRSKYEKAKRYFNNEIENANQRIYQLQSKYEYLDMYINGGAARGGLTNTKLKQIATCIYFID